MKVFVWFAGAASVIFRFYGPADKGGAGNLRAKAEQEAARSGITVEAATAEVRAYICLHRNCGFF